MIKQNLLKESISSPDDKTIFGCIYTSRKLFHKNYDLYSNVHNTLVCYMPAIRIHGNASLINQSTPISISINILQLAINKRRIERESEILV